MVGESRSELLQWLNATLDLDYTKVEQCGSGAAYCQLLDSIYGDIPMSRVNFTTKLEYEYLNNMKVLQSGFSKHKITKNIDVNRLAKCRLQDNLELLQWFKKYWMENKDLNQPYDAIGRRMKKKGRSVSAGTGGTSYDAGSTASSGVKPTPVKKPISVSVGGKPRLSNDPCKKCSDYEAQILDLTSSLQAVTQSNDEVSAERQFYFTKLREIELLVTNALPRLELGETIDVTEVLKEIQSILYQPEEGFSVDEEMEQSDEF